MKGGDVGCDDINECSINDGTCANSCSNYQGGYSCGCQNRAFKVGNRLVCSNKQIPYHFFSHCISSPNGFEQFGLQSGPVSRDPPARGQGRHICYGCSHEERARRQLGQGRRRQRQQRQRRGTGELYTLIEMEGASPNDEIEKTLPIEVK